MAISRRGFFGAIAGLFVPPAAAHSVEWTPGRVIEDWRGYVWGEQSLIRSLPDIRSLRYIRIVGAATTINASDYFTRLETSVEWR